MSSKYDNIGTAAELVSEVQLHGLSLAQEDICRAQDIFGHTSIEELARLANDIGRDNEKGEPDPKGSRSSGRRATQSTFYSILTNIWHWEEVTRFWNTYTNPPTEELKRNRDAYDFVVEGNKKLKSENDELKEQVDELLERESGLVLQRDEALDRAEYAEAEVVRLKAKLYDLLVERKEVV